jgi:hypothetical protein
MRPSRQVSATLRHPNKGIKVKVNEGTAHPITGHEGPEGSRGIALLFL